MTSTNNVQPDEACEDAQAAIPPGLATPLDFDLTRPVGDMSDRDLLMEIAYQLRSFGAALADFQQMGPGGIMKMLMGGKK